MSKVYSNKMGHNLKTRRLQQGYSQKQLGDLVGMSKQVISNIERGVTNSIYKSNLKYIAYNLNCSENYILNGDTVGVRDEYNKSTNTHIIQRNADKSPDLFILLCKVNETCSKEEINILTKFMETLIGEV